MQKRNLAARAGLWSASHRKKAIFGWLAFVTLAVLLGGSVGQQMLAAHFLDRLGDHRQPGHHPEQDRQPDEPAKPAEVAAALILLPASVHASA